MGNTWKDNKRKSKKLQREVEGDEMPKKQKHSFKKNRMSVKQSLRDVKRDYDRNNKQ